MMSEMVRRDDQDTLNYFFKSQEIIALKISKKESYYRRGGQEMKG